MPVSSTAAAAPVKLVKHAISPKTVQADLKARGLKAFRWHCLCGLNIFRVNRINKDQYQYFLSLLDLIAAEIERKKYVVGKGELLPLDLPGSGSLRHIPFDRLLQSAEAVKEVLARCVFPKGKSKVDLGILPWIYQNYADIPQQ